MFWKFLIAKYKELRNKDGVSLASAAAGVDMDRQYINQIENCKYCPSVETFQKLLLELGYTLTIVPISSIEDKRIKSELLKVCYEESAKLVEFDSQKYRNNASLRYLERMEAYFDAYMKMPRKPKDDDNKGDNV